LVFDVGAIRPLIDTNKELVGPVPLDKIRYIKLGRIPASLGIPNLNAIHPEMIGAVNSLKPNPKLT
jgi:hypothetical protein